jgi:hypothetical protein
MAVAIYPFFIIFQPSLGFIVVLFSIIILRVNSAKLNFKFEESHPKARFFEHNSAS